MMMAAMVMIVFNVVFWTLFEQAGSSLTLFADRNTDLSIFGLFSINAGQTQFFNAAFIVLLAPVLSVLWNALLAKAQSGATHAGEVRDRADGRGRRLPVPRLGRAVCVGPDFEVGGMVAGRALPDPFGGRAVHLASGPVDDHQAIHRAHRRHDDGHVVPVDLGCAQYVAGVVAQVASRRDGGRRR